MSGKILVVGGEGSEIRPAVAEQLRKNGHGVHEAMSAGDGFNIFFIEMNNKEPFSLVIISNLDFWNLAFEIVKARKVPNVKILAITERGIINGELERKLESYARKNGVTAFFPKINLYKDGKLEAVVTNLLNNQHTQKKKKKNKRGYVLPLSSAPPLSDTMSPRGYWARYELPKCLYHNKPQTRLPA